MVLLLAQSSARHFTPGGFHDWYDAAR